MSVLFAVNYELFGIVIADSRVTFPRGAYTDNCQKVNLFTSAGLVGWCGELNIVSYLMHQVFAPIARAEEDPWSILDEEKMRIALTDNVMKSSPAGTAHFVFALVQPLANAWGSIPQSVEMAALTVQKNAQGWKLHHDKMPFGEARLFGSGTAIAADLAELEISSRTLAHVAGGQISEQGVAHRCIALEQIISGKLGGRVRSVGGMLQLTYILNDRARFLSYEKWVRCGNGYGTFATFDIEEGRMVQVHKPTGIRAPIFNPLSEGHELSRARIDFLAALRRMKRGDLGVEAESGQPSSRYLFQHGPMHGEATYRPLILPK